MFINLILKDFIIDNKFNVINLLEIVEKANSLGIKNLVISPCYYDKESKTSIEEVNEIIEDLNFYLKEKGQDIKLYSGNLIRDNYDNVKDFVDNKIGSINNTKYVLLNSEESEDLNELLEIVYEFRLRKYIPVIIAPEKLREVKDNYKDINKLIKEECLFQLDLSSINGDYGKEVLKIAKILYKRDIYSFVGFKDEIKKKNINKDTKKIIETISKKSVDILMKNIEIQPKEISAKIKLMGFMKR